MGSRRVWSALLVAAMAAGTGAAAACVIGSALTVTDTQSGFAGVTGTVWTIRPDCTFAVARVLAGARREPHRTGTLTQAQQERLEDILGRNAARDLSGRFGSPVQVNGREIKLELSGHSASLLMGPGETSSAAIRAAGPGDAAKRLLETAAAIERLLGP